MFTPFSCIRVSHCHFTADKLNTSIPSDDSLMTMQMHKFSTNIDMIIVNMIIA